MRLLILPRSDPACACFSSAPSITSSAAGSSSSEALLLPFRSPTTLEPSSSVSTRAGVLIPDGSRDDGRVVATSGLPTKRILMEWLRIRVDSRPSVRTKRRVEIEMSREIECWQRQNATSGGEGTKDSQY